MPGNMLFFLTDQHRVDTLGCYGNSRVSTPHLDRLAGEGTTFDRFYTPTAICAPARASLLTGSLPFRHQLLANYERNVGYREELADDAFTFSGALRDQGYNLGLVGKWHVGTRRTPQDFGFDGEDFRGWHNPVEHPAYQQYLADNNFPPYKITRQMRGTFPNGNEGNLLAACLEQPVEATFEYFLAEQVIDLLRRYAADHDEDGKPFLLAAHFFGPHLPYIVPEEYFDRHNPDQVELPTSVTETFAQKPAVQQNYSAHWAFDTMTEAESRKLIAAYWGYVELIDEQIGRILDVARELGVYDDSTIFFSADHGEFTGAHRLHDKGPAMYEDIYRIPALLRSPGGAPGTRSDAYTTLIDFTATIMDVAELDPAKVVDGASLLPLTLGEAGPSTSSGNVGTGSGSVGPGSVSGEWRDHVIIEFHGHHFPYPQRGLIRDDVKLIINPESVNELYLLREDPHELQNRYDDPACGELRGDMLRLLYTELRDRGDNFFHWMSTMYEVGAKDYDPTLSSFETKEMTETP